MGNLVSSFRKWQQLEEQENTQNNAKPGEKDPGDERFFKVEKSKPTKTKWRTKEDGLQGVNVKIKDGGFKLVVKNDANLIDTDGKTLVKGAWNGIKDFIASKQGLSGIYSQIKDPKQNKVVYEIRQGESGSSRQVISFDIVPASNYPNTQEQAISKSAAQSGGDAKSTILKTGADATKSANSTDATKVSGDADKAKNTAAASTELPGFDLSKFPLKQQNGVQDAVKPYQKLILDKIKGTKLANTPIFKRAAYYGADGKYGDITGAATKILKKGLGYKDEDGSIVDKDFVSLLSNESINEGYLWYGKVVEAFDMDAAIAAEASIRSSVVKTKDSGDTKKADTGKSTSSDTSKDGDKDTKKADTSKDSGKDAKKDTRKKLSPKLQAFKTLLQSDEVSQDVKDAIKKYHRIGVTKEGKLYKVKDRAQEMADARSGNSKKTNYLE